MNLSKMCGFFRGRNKNKKIQGGKHMRVGCVKEIKNNEFRVGMTPDNVKNYVRAGHEVYIERDAGVGSGFTTEQYEKAGLIFWIRQRTYGIRVR